MGRTTNLSLVSGGKTAGMLTGVEMHVVLQDEEVVVP